jgi:hypothetical protein
VTDSTFWSEVDLRDQRQNSLHRKVREAKAGRERRARAYLVCGTGRQQLPDDRGLCVNGQHQGENGSGDSEKESTHPVAPTRQRVLLCGHTDVRETRPKNELLIVAVR